MLRRFDIKDGCLEGSIPKELGDLPVLRLLVIKNQPNLESRLPKELSKLKLLTKMDFSGNPMVWPCNCTVGDEECEKEKLAGAHIPRDDNGKQLVHLYKHFNDGTSKEYWQPNKWGNCIYCQRICGADGGTRFDCGDNDYVFSSKLCECGSNFNTPNISPTDGSGANTVSGATHAFTCAAGYVASGVATCTNGVWNTPTCV